MGKLFKNFTKKDNIMIILCFLFIIAQVYLELKMPDYMSEITRLVQSDVSNMNEILKQGTFMLLCAFGSLVSAIIVGYLAANISSNFSMIIKGKIFNKVQDFGSEDIKKF